MRIHFEGMDLAGKSTVCRLFQKHVPGNWQMRHNSLILANPVHALADKLRLDDFGTPESVGWLYHAALIHDIEAYQRTDDDIIQDSTIILRSLAYHKARGTPGLADRLESLLARHPRFDHSFVLVANHETRLHRLAIRRPANLAPEDFLVRDNPKLFYSMEKTLVENAQLHFGAVTLDTSGDLNAAWLENIFRHAPEIRPPQVVD